MSILFLSDIDGTLVNGHDMSRRVKPKLEEFTFAGNLFGLATGRHAFGMKWLCEELPVNAPCILLAGAALYDPLRDNIFHVKAMPAGTEALLKKVYDEYPDMTIQVFHDAGLTNLRLSEFMATHGIPEERSKGVGPISELDGRQVLKIGLTNEKVYEIEEVAEGLFADRRYYDWHMSYIIGAEILNPAASKGVSVDEIVEAMPVRPKLIAAAGDSPNDLPLFEKADVCFAPEDAFPEVKEKADFIVPTAAEGGVADAIDILLQKYC